MVLKLNAMRRTSIRNELPQRYLPGVAARLEHGRPRG
jgi:hypothetical protein